MPEDCVQKKVTKDGFMILSSHSKKELVIGKYN